MKKVVLSVVAALALTATVPALAADMPVKAAPAAPAAAPSPWDVAFGAAFTTDYDLRGVSQSNHKPAAQGYFEVDYTATDWLKLYAGMLGIEPVDRLCRCGVRYHRRLRGLSLGQLRA